MSLESSLEDVIGLSGIISDMVSLEGRSCPLYKDYGTSLIQASLPSFKKICDAIVLGVPPSHLFLELG